MRTLLLTIVAAAVVLAGCKKPQPSEDFTQASNDFASLYGQKLDEAYVDPRMNGILEQLKRVPNDSADAEAAKGLIARIEENQRRVEAENKTRLANQEKILKAEAVPFNPTPTETQTPREQPAVVEPPRDAGTATPKEPKFGMPVAEFEKLFGDCFEPGPEIYVGGARTGPAQSRSLLNYNRCKDKLPGFDQKFVLIQNGTVIQIMNKSEIQAVTLRPDGGTVEPGR